MKSDRAIWMDEIDSISKSVSKQFGGMTIKQLNSRPNASVWSIAENLEHLISVNTSYNPTFESLLSGTYSIPWTGKSKFITRFFGNMILNSVQPVNKRKTKTPNLWEPSRSDIDSDLLGRFEASQNSLKDYMSKLEYQIDNDVVISSPANKFIVYTLSKGFDIIPAHEKRHLQQATSLLTT